MVPLALEVVEEHGMRRAHWVIAIGVLGFALMIGVMQHVASDRWDIIKDAIDAGAEQVTSGAGPAVFEAPGTTVTVSTDGGRERIVFDTLSEEACYVAWATYAPLSGPVSFEDGKGGMVVIFSGSPDAGRLVVDACQMAGSEKSAVYPIL